MSDNNMSLSVNGHSKVPPGFRFHPTEEELLHYYLRKKVANEKIDLDVISDVDLNKLEPWDIQEKCRIGSTPQNDWYFFSHKDKKYPTGTRTNRATAAGFWKATGRDKPIHSNSTRIGMRKTLVFYRGRAPHGQKSDWIMHEYRLDDNTTPPHDSTNAYANGSGDSGPEEGWVVCRVFKKKNYHKSSEIPLTSSNSVLTGNLPGNDVVLDQILTYMGKSSPPKQDNISQSNYDHYENIQFPNQPTPFVHLPGLDSSAIEDCIFKSTVNDQLTQIGPSSEPSDWASLDRLVAAQLNGSSYGSQATINGDFSFPFDQNEVQLLNMHSSDDQETKHQVSNSVDTDFWSFTRSSSFYLSSSSSDPLCHLSV